MHFKIGKLVGEEAVNCFYGRLIAYGMATLGFLFYVFRPKWCRRYKRIGYVSEIILYPVSSCEGLAVSKAFCGKGGLEKSFIRDREFVVVAIDKHNKMEQFYSPDLGNIKILIDARNLVFVTQGMHDLRVPINNSRGEAIRYDVHGVSDKVMRGALDDISSIKQYVFLNGCGQLEEGMDCGKKIAGWLSKFFEGWKLRLYRRTDIVRWRQKRKDAFDDDDELTKYMRHFEDKYWKEITEGPDAERGLGREGYTYDWKKKGKLFTKLKGKFHKKSKGKNKSGNKSKNDTSDSSGKEEDGAPNEMGGSDREKKKAHQRVHFPDSKKDDVVWEKTGHVWKEGRSSSSSSAESLSPASPGITKEVIGFHTDQKEMKDDSAIIMAKRQEIEVDDGLFEDEYFSLMYAREIHYKAKEEAEDYEPRLGVITIHTNKSLHAVNDMFQIPPTTKLAARHVKANIVIKGCDNFSELAWDMLYIGEWAKLKVQGPDVRFLEPEFTPSSNTFRSEPEPIDNLFDKWCIPAASPAPVAGIKTTVMKEAEIRVGDPVCVLDSWSFFE